MARINFDKVGDMQDFSPLPPGQYLCRLTDVERKETKDSDEMWNLRFEVIEQGSEFFGRKIFDNMVFSKSAYPRVKFICSRLGFKAEGKVDLQPEDLIGRSCLITVEIDKYEEPITGGVKERNKVPWAGYGKTEEQGETKEPKTKAAAGKGEGEGKDDFPF